MSSKNALRVIGYVRRAEFSARLDVATSFGGVVGEEVDGTARVAIPVSVLTAEGAEQAGKLVAKILGSDEVPRHQLVVQPNSEFSEVSITLIDLSEKPSRVVQAGVASVSRVVADFVQSGID